MTQEQISSNQHQKSKTLLILILVVVILSVAFALWWNKQTQSATITYTNQDEIPRVTAEEAYQAISKGKAVLVDTRPTSAFTVLHAAGAISLPIDQLEKNLPALDPDRWYITYCS